jgi:hypothetical protein
MKMMELMTTGLSVKLGIIVTYIAMLYLYSLL